MKKEIIVFIGLTVLAGVIFYADQIVAMFAGMTPLEALKQIVSFALHTAVVTICGFVVAGLPKIVKPWMKMLKQRRTWHPGPGAQWQSNQARAPKLTNDQKFMLMLERMNHTPARRPSAPLPPMYHQGDDSSQIKLDF